MSGWQEVRPTEKEESKSITMDRGEQSVITTSTTVKLVSSAIVLDSG